MKLIFGTGNTHKVDEARKILSGVEVVSTRDMGLELDVEENGETFADNALIKARAIHQEVGMPCFAEDSGLVVEALGGEPGIYSARYAEMNGSRLSNLDLVLERMQGTTDRRAYFIAVIAVMGVSEEPLFFEGRVYGTLSHEARGEQGFGYDPIFIPQGHDRTFGELGASVKDEVSHRKNALETMRDRIMPS